MCMCSVVVQDMLKKLGVRTNGECPIADTKQLAYARYNVKQVGLKTLILGSAYVKANPKLLACSKCNVNQKESAFSTNQVHVTFCTDFLNCCVPMPGTSAKHEPVVAAPAATAPVCTSFPRHVFPAMPGAGDTAV